MYVGNLQSGCVACFLPSKRNGPLQTSCPPDRPAPVGSSRQNSWPTRVASPFAPLLSSLLVAYCPATQTSAARTASSTKQSPSPQLRDACSWRVTHLCPRTQNRRPAPAGQAMAAAASDAPAPAEAPPVSVEDLDSLLPGCCFSTGVIHCFFRFDAEARGCLWVRASCIVREE